jgi:hypothetical protein
LANARRSGITDILLAKVTIPKTNEEINQKIDEAKSKFEISPIQMS